MNLNYLTIFPSSLGNQLLCIFSDKEGATKWQMTWWIFFFFCLISLKEVIWFIIFKVLSLFGSKIGNHFYFPISAENLHVDYDCPNAFLNTVSWWLLSSIAGCFTQIKCGTVIGSGSQVLFCSYLLCVLCVFLFQVSKNLSLSNPEFNSDHVAFSITVLCVGLSQLYYLSFSCIVTVLTGFYCPWPLWLLCEYFYFDHCSVF